MSDEITAAEERIAELEKRLAALETQPPTSSNLVTIPPPAVAVDTSRLANLESRLAQVFTIATQLFTMQQTQMGSLQNSDAERQRRAAADERQKEWIKLLTAVVAAIIAGIEIYRGAVH